MNKNEHTPNKPHDEKLRRQAEELKGEMASTDPVRREQAAEEFRNQPGLESSNGAPASNRAAHRRH